ncbi:hypothetical protein GJW-30_1_01413 [Variibacter gotjawalensis]|uniref:Enolase C-terminal domain-containing protein n=1 Tax=Variibacter gotjawalensis TaxID=1333996 RepID=A0A0S3PSE9_9BRAD|nr:enolase C-terminal domain-like protein [Variibacter gotjawalensis]NIK49197.1 hypothetical protein [Variibacter gotjawalensis]RZS51051.1 L-alanine-DL-glutamate epimerase-like enolase superfamily enzyme [Variibacter gotjawalensis]BAT58885.1 hypothetical protein GJW-30_1_01413 [Variibacter gotjawalensis]
MTEAPRIRVLAIEPYERTFRLRLPFRFGNTTVTHGTQIIMRARIATQDGREGWGYTSESIASRWFDKNPALSDQQAADQMRTAVLIAQDAYLAAGANTPFGHYADLYNGQIEACAKRGLLPLVASYGPALIDRCIIDAICRLEGISFYRAMQQNVPGMAPHAVAPDLAGFDFAAFLKTLKPANVIEARHTVGLLDPLVASDQKAGERVDDGLPETLEEVIAAYGHRYFKLKVGGDLEADIDRLCRIASVIARVPDYRVTIDGNEQYENAEAALTLWRAIENEPKLKQLAAATLFVEQPIKRQTALEASVAPFAAAKAVIIDESDGEIDTFVRAKALGYAGISSKVCKGFYKSTINRIRCAQWNAAEGHEHYFMSAEDLTVHAGTSVQQDLALVNLLGLRHVERNGHHFIDGFADRPESESRAFLTAHPDLYHEQSGRVRLNIRDGKLNIASLDCVGMGALPTPSVEGLKAMPQPASA